MDTYKFHKGMKQYFGIKRDAGQFMCKAYLLRRECRLNIIKFDKWIQKDLGFDYILKYGLSMKEALVKYYGRAAMLFIQEAL